MFSAFYSRLEATLLVENEMATMLEDEEEEEGGETATEMVIVVAMTVLPVAGSHHCHAVVTAVFSHYVG